MLAAHNLNLRVPAYASQRHCNRPRTNMRPAGAITLFVVVFSLAMKEEVLSVGFFFFLF
jgi:hypothetical protein